MGSEVDAYYFFGVSRLSGCLSRKKTPTPRLRLLLHLAGIFACGITEVSGESDTYLVEGGNLSSRSYSCRRGGRLL